VASATCISQVSLLHHQARVDGESSARRAGTSPGNFSSIPRWAGSVFGLVAAAFRRAFVGFRLLNEGGKPKLAEILD
jgi:hypothetical protein